MREGSAAPYGHPEVGAGHWYARQVSTLATRVDELYTRIDTLDERDADARALVEEAIALLDAAPRGSPRWATAGEVVVHEWLKRAILLLFRLRGITTEHAGPFEYADRLPLKDGYEDAGVRVVPGAIARWGSYLAPGVILMPSFVNIGARVGARTLVDTWATVGSCAQIGADVHLGAASGSGACSSPSTRSPSSSRTVR